MEADDGRVAIFREHPPQWWAWPWRLPRPLSVAELIAAGTLDAELAALFWVALERRASLLVAAGPNGAGKTVILTALLDFLPTDVQRVHLQGMAEDFAFVGHVDPARTYLLCNEISDHLPIYLWGRRVRRLFELLGQGFALGATLHADSAEETVDFLRAPPLAVPDALLAQVTLIVTLVMFRRGGELLRRVQAVHVLAASRGGLAHEPLALREPAADRLRYPPEAVDVLARRLGTPTPALQAAAAARAGLLADLVERGQVAPNVVRTALAAHGCGGGP